ncbi:MAG: hypothetical protein CSA83_01700 [Actinomycetales bacterium]|nr:MAG: hypothetical protein CSA83_01700 [Actinomycetales bacterium]
MHKKIYWKRKDISVIKLCSDGEVAHFRGQTMRPYLDDFARLVGNAANQDLRSNVLLLPDQVFCLGKSLRHTVEMELALRKNARAARIAKLSGTVPIARWDAYLMNLRYQRKYFKQTK